MNSLVSIIIPVYNGERFISSCLTSITNQTYKELQVIIVDDGSTDQTENIYQDYSQSFSFIEYHKKQNGGVSSARNLGISLAKGKYVLFLDADDMLKENSMIEFLVKNIESGNVDGAVFGFEVQGTELRKNDKTSLSNIIKENSIIPTKEIIEKTLTIDEEKEIYGYVWRYLFSLEIILSNRLLFDESLKISEDYLFIIQFLLLAEKMYVTDKSLYIYNCNNSSATSKYISSLEQDMYTVNNWIINNIYPKFPSVVEEHQGCIANSYLGFVQNIGKVNYPYSIFYGIKSAYQIKKEHEYKKPIKNIAKSGKCRKKALFGFLLFKYNLDWIYIILYWIKEKKRMK